MKSGNLTFDNIEYEKLTLANLEALKKIALQTFTDAFAAQNSEADFLFYLTSAFIKIAE